MDITLLSAFLGGVLALLSPCAALLLPAFFGSTVGTGNAIQEAGQTVIGVGFDKSDTILNLIKNGYILCTMAQNPDVMGYEGIQTAVKALEGEDVGEEFIDTGVSVINKDSL